MFIFTISLSRNPVLYYYLDFALSDVHLFLKLSNTWKFSNNFSNEIVKSVAKKRFRRIDADFFMNELKKN